MALSKLQLHFSYILKLQQQLLEKCGVVVNVLMIYQVFDQQYDQ